MVAERAADVPRAGPFPDKADKIEVVFFADVIGPDRKAFLQNWMNRYVAWVKKHAAGI